MKEACQSEINGFNFRRLKNFISEVINMINDEDYKGTPPGLNCVIVGHREEYHKRIIQTLEAGSEFAYLCEKESGFDQGNLVKVDDVLKILNEVLPNDANRNDVILRVMSLPYQIL